MPSCLSSTTSSLRYWSETKYGATGIISLVCICSQIASTFFIFSSIYPAIGCATKTVFIAKYYTYQNKGFLATAIVVGGLSSTGLASLLHIAPGASRSSSQRTWSAPKAVAHSGHDTVLQLISFVALSRQTWRGVLRDQSRSLA